MSPVHKPRKSRARHSHTAERHGVAPARVIRRLDPRGRPHVAAIVALGVIGWHVTKIRPDIHGDAPVLWRVTITRYDEAVSITVTEADPDVALEELARYTAADASEVG